MFVKFFAFLVLVISNLALYYFSVLLNAGDTSLVFILVRAVFVTSLLMQLLTASGIARAQRMW